MSEANHKLQSSAGMTKTPEQMAVEWLKEEYGDTSNWTYMGQEMSLDAFYAGYQAAKDQVANVSKVMPKWNSVDTVEDLINRSAIQHTLAALEKKPAQQWISVKERLPKDGQVVLTSCEQGKMFLLRKVSEEFLGGTLLWKYCCGYDKSLAEGESYCYEISHWMPLPTAPKEEV